MFLTKDLVALVARKLLYPKMLSTLRHPLGFFCHTTCSTTYWGVVAFLVTVRHLTIVQDPIVLGQKLAETSSEIAGALVHFPRYQ